MLDPSLREPFPTVLEIRGFGTDRAVQLRELFNTLLQQPSYVSHARLLADSAGAGLHEMRLALPLGMALSFVEVHSWSGTAWALSEVSPCCLAELKGGRCLRCATDYETRFIQEFTVHPFAQVREESADGGEESPVNEEASWKATGYPAMEMRLVERLRAEGLDSFSALFIAQELTNLFWEVLQ